MDDQQQRRFRAAYLYYARWYGHERLEVWQQRQQCYQARWAEFRDSVRQQFAPIRAEFRAIESVLQEVLAAQAHLLHRLDQQLAELNGEPPPEQIPNRHFIGKRSLKGPAFEKSYERQLRTRRLRSNYDGCWYNRVFPTVEEADEYVRQEAEKKAAKRAERKAKRMVRMERWLGERLGVEKSR